MSAPIDPGLMPPGLVVNTMKGDPGEHRAGSWLEWDGRWEGLQAALLGIPFDGASVVRTGSRHGPDSVRRSMMYYTTYSSGEGRAMTGFRAADIGDVATVVTDLAGSHDRITTAIAALVGRGIVPVSIGGDHSISFPIIRGVVQGLGAGKRLGVIHSTPITICARRISAPNPAACRSANRWSCWTVPCPGGTWCRSAWRNSPTRPSSPAMRRSRG